MSSNLPQQSLSMSDYLHHAAKPKGQWGAEVLRGMNDHHTALANWAFSHVVIPPFAHALDIGCGGGANLARLASLCPEGFVTGIDYSPTSVEESIAFNQDIIDRKRMTVLEGDVHALPFERDAFDFISACETIYFWNDLPQALFEVRRVLKPQGTFLIICEMADPNDPRFKDESCITIYLPRDMKQLVEEAGFSSVSLFEQDGWYCIVARNE